MQSLKHTQDFSSDTIADGKQNIPELPLQPLHNKNAVTMISEKQSYFRFQRPRAEDEHSLTCQNHERLPLLSNTCMNAFHLPFAWISMCSNCAWRRFRPRNVQLMDKCMIPQWPSCQIDKIILNNGIVANEMCSPTMKDEEKKRKKRGKKQEK